MGFGRFKVLVSSVYDQREGAHMHARCLQRVTAMILATEQTARVHANMAAAATRVAKRKQGPTGEAEGCILAQHPQTSLAKHGLRARCQHIYASGPAGYSHWCGGGKQRPSRANDLNVG